jgi:hypothetical protein
VDHRLHDDLHPLIALLRRLGNPLRSEAAAFRWLVLIAAAVALLSLIVVIVR